METKRLQCVICGAEISYTFGRPRKICGNPQCERALQKLRVRRFKLKQKKLKSEAVQATLKTVVIDSYEPTMYSTDLGNLLNIGAMGSLKVVPDYYDAIFQGYRDPSESTLEFVKDSFAFYRRYPDLVRFPDKLRHNPKAHRIGGGAAQVICGVCGSSSLLWRSDGGWFCQGCGNDTDFSLPLY